MDLLLVTIPADKINDWASFHEVFRDALGFPVSYGRSMDAWIDCMTSIDSPSDGLSSVTVRLGQILVLRLDDPFEFRKRCPEQYEALIESVAFVNFRRCEIGEAPVIALLLSGRT